MNNEGNAPEKEKAEEGNLAPRGTLIILRQKTILFLSFFALFQKRYYVKNLERNFVMQIK